MALGFPDELYEKYFLANPKAEASPNPLSDFATPFYIEVELASEMQLSLEQWSKIPSMERKLRLYHRILKNEKEKFAIAEQERQAKMKASIKDNLPPVSRLPRVLSRG